MDRKPLITFFFILFKTGHTLKCHVCEVANPFDKCIWGKNTCTAGLNETCEVRLAVFDPFFYLAWLGCAPQSPSCNESGLSDSFFGFTYNVTCCNDEDFCNTIPKFQQRWPWSGGPCQGLPNTAVIFMGTLLLLWAHLS